MIQSIFSLFQKYPYKTWVGIFLFFSIFGILAGNLLSVIHNCFDVYDLGIYHQAITEISIRDFNPYLTVRDIKIFNDHFDPILLLAVPFVRLFGNIPEGTIVFEFLWYLVFIFLLANAVYKENITAKQDQKITLILLIIFMTVFSRGILTGVLFPIHPTFWSIIPLFLICKYVKEQNFKGVFLSSFFLCFFKEIFPPALIVFSLYYALRKNWKYFFSLFLLGAFGNLFCFYLRPLWLGEIHPWTSHVFSSNSLGEWIIKVFSNGQYNSAFRLLYPFIIPFFLLYKHEIKKEGLKHFSIPLLFLILPLFALHFINRELWYQYSSVTLGPLLTILALSSVPKMIVKNKKLLGIVCLLFLVNGFNKYRAQLGIVIRVLEDSIGTNYMERLAGSYKHCFLTSRHRQTIKQVQRILDEKAKEKKIFATGGVIPRIITPGRKIYGLRGPSKIQPIYDIFLFEVDYLRGFRNNQIKRIKSSCSKFIRKIHMDNDYYYLAEGKFPSTCL